MKTYEFTLALRGLTELTPAIEDALFEAGCSDATLWLQAGEVLAVFAREGTSKYDAIQSAMRDVEKAKAGATPHYRFERTE